MEGINESIERFIAAKLIVNGIIEDYEIIKGKEFAVRIIIKDKKKQNSLNKFVNFYIKRILFEYKILKLTDELNNAVKEKYKTWKQFNETVGKTWRNKPTTIKEIEKTTKTLNYLDREILIIEKKYISDVKLYLNKLKIKK